MIGLQSVRSGLTVRVNKNNYQCLYSVKVEEVKFAPSVTLHSKTDLQKVCLKVCLIHANKQ